MGSWLRSSAEPLRVLVGPSLQGQQQPRAGGPTASQRAADWRASQQRTERVEDKEASPADAEEAPNRRKPQIFPICSTSCCAPSELHDDGDDGDSPAKPSRAASHIYLPARQGLAVLHKHPILVGSPVHIKADYRVDEADAKLSESRHTAYYF